ncbi:MAG TPA: hypothetical protein VGG71_13470 [Chitinophagaceae bacterium]|jgi:hypothetical protein
MRTISLIFSFIVFMLYGCAEVFEKSLTNEQVELSAPANNLISEESMQTFYWQRLEGAKSYQLQVVCPNFDSIVILIADTTIQTNVFPMNLDSGRYEWRVRAINASSSTPFSDPRQITIQ